MSQRTEYVCDRCGQDAHRGATLHASHTWGKVQARIDLGGGGTPIYEMGREPPRFEGCDLCNVCLGDLKDWLCRPPTGPSTKESAPQ